jgi:DNA-binding PadR family transcriptional regulator
MFSDPVSKSLEWSRKGYMGMALLLMINEKPLTGYDIMRSIKETTQGFWKPTPGGVYPVLKKLETEGLVHGDWFTYNGRKHKTYVITEDGKRTLEHVLLKQSEIALGINRLFDGFIKDMFGLENPHIAPHSIFAFFTTEVVDEELKELEARRVTILNLMESLQQCLNIIDSKITEEKKKSTF